MYYIITRIDHATHIISYKTWSGEWTTHRDLAAIFKA